MAQTDDKLTPPLPTPTPTSRPFWDGLREGRVRLQQCGACGGWVFYPRVRCSHCLADALEWHDVSGLGSLYTWTVCERPTAPPFAAWGTYVLAVVELDEGVRMTTLLVDAPPESLRAGMRMRPVLPAPADSGEPASADEAPPLLRYTPA